RLPRPWRSRRHRPARRGARRLRGSARPRRVGADPAPRCRGRAMSDRRRPLPSPRDDLALMAGYHSPQVDVAVRLNTNESPEPPPPALVARLAEVVGSTAWNRYPDRGYRDLRAAIAAHHGVRPDQVF